MTFAPRRCYSAVAVLSPDLERIVLIHKLKPSWQVGKANLPGGKVEVQDYIDGETWEGTYEEACDLVYRRCAARELAEETGLVVDAATLKPFCILRYKSREGDDAECRLYAVHGDVEAARTMEQEPVFIAHAPSVLNGKARYIPTMPNLPWLVTMARQCLRGEDEAAWPLTVYEAGATP